MPYTMLHMQNRFAVNQKGFLSTNRTFPPENYKMTAKLMKIILTTLKISAHFKNIPSMPVKENK